MRTKCGAGEQQQQHADRNGCGAVDWWRREGEEATACWTADRQPDVDAKEAYQATNRGEPPFSFL